MDFKIAVSTPHSFVAEKPALTPALILRKDDADAMLLK